MKKTVNKSLVGALAWLATSPLFNNGEVANHIWTPTQVLSLDMFNSSYLATFGKVSKKFISNIPPTVK